MMATDLEADAPEHAAHHGDVGKLVEAMQRCGQTLRPDAGERLVSLAGSIQRWNQAINLVSRKDVAKLVTYHFCDSASLLPILAPHATMEVLDVGGSNGLPGLVLSALSPHLKVTICDSRQKRRGFLEEVCRADASGTRGAVGFEIDRVDSARFQNRYAAHFDLILARAVTRLKPLLRWCMPLLRPGGALVAYKGSCLPEEVSQAETYFFAHGGRILAIVASPWGKQCNPLRLFAIAVTARSA